VFLQLSDLEALVVELRQQLTEKSTALKELQKKE